MYELHVDSFSDAGPAAVASAPASGMSPAGAAASSSEPYPIPFEPVSSSPATGALAAGSIVSAESLSLPAASWARLQSQRNPSAAVLGSSLASSEPAAASGPSTPPPSSVTLSAQSGDAADSSNRNLAFELESSLRLQLSSSAALELPAGPPLLTGVLDVCLVWTQLVAARPVRRFAFVLADLGSASASTTLHSAVAVACSSASAESRLRPLDLLYLCRLAAHENSAPRSASSSSSSSVVGLSHTLLHDEDLALLLGDAVDEAMGESAMASALWARASTVAAESRRVPPPPPPAAASSSHAGQAAPLSGIVENHF